MYILLTFVRIHVCIYLSIYLYIYIYIYILCYVMLCIYKYDVYIHISEYNLHSLVSVDQTLLCKVLWFPHPGVKF